MNLDTNNSIFNEIWYTPDGIKNLVMLLNEVKSLEGDIIEIGCWEGLSTYNIVNTAYPEVVICNDTWLGNVEESKCTGVKHVTEVILEQRDVYNTFKNNMKYLTKCNYEVVKKDCIKWLTNDYNGKIKFCHIDASHEYESVYKTIELILPKLVDGGILCGDDFLTANIENTSLHGGVERAVREFFPNVENYGNLWFYKHNV